MNIWDTFFCEFKDINQHVIYIPQFSYIFATDGNAVSPIKYVSTW